MCDQSNQATTIATKPIATMVVAANANANANNLVPAKSINHKKENKNKVSIC